MSLSRSQKRQRIKYRIRKTVVGTASNPRLTVFRSNKEIYAQVVDDVTGVTLLSASSRDKELSATGTKVEVASQVGEAIAKKAIDAGLSSVVFDRAGYLYHGRVKSLAEGARKGGLNF